MIHEGLLLFYCRNVVVALYDALLPMTRNNDKECARYLLILTVQGRIK